MVTICDAVGQLAGDSVRLQAGDFDTSHNRCNQLVSEVHPPMGPHRHSRASNRTSHRTQSPNTPCSPTLAYNNWLLVLFTRPQTHATLSRLQPPNLQVQNLLASVCRRGTPSSSGPFW